MARDRARELIAEADARRLAASLRPKPVAAARPSRPRVRMHVGHALLHGWGGERRRGDDVHEVANRPNGGHHVHTAHYAALVLATAATTLTGLLLSALWARPVTGVGNW